MTEGGKRGGEESQEVLAEQMDQHIQGHLEVESAESEPTERTVVALNFMRHGKKDKGEDQKTIRLTPLGKLQALCSVVGEDLGGLPRGSERQRAQETAGISALAADIIKELGVSRDALVQLRDKVAKNEELDETEQALLERANEIMSLESLEGRFEEKFGAEAVKWIDHDTRLDFDDSGPVGDELNNAYVDGYLMKFMVKDSDRRVLEAKDNKTTSITKLAAEQANLVLSYVEVGKDLRTASKSMADSKPDEYAKLKHGDALVYERYFGNHASVAESFLLKMAEVLEDRGVVPAGTRDEILAKMGTSFKETEGFRLEIANTDTDQTMTIIMSERITPASGPELTFTKEDLEKLIAAGQELEAKKAE